MTVYVNLTHRFNEGGLRAILSSGQAVVLHRLAIMSKDGDWILREITGLPLRAAHAIVINRAEGILPFRPMEAAG